MYIRPYHPTDIPAIYRIGLLTGHDGDDATHLFKHPNLIGHFYAAPYVTFEPECAFVLVNEGRTIGYILGTKDSAEFGKWCEANWFAPLRERYPLMPADDKSLDADLIRAIHRGHDTVNHHPDYPAHLHIDLLPAGQGGGWGLKMMETFWDKLRSFGVPGVHLGVSKKNLNAVGFYKHIGYDVLVDHEWGFELGKRL